MKKIYHIRILKFPFLALALSLNLLSGKSWSQPSLSLQPVITTGLTTPMQIVNAGDGSGRIFVVERAGVIKVFGGTLVNGELPFRDTFLDLNVPEVKVGTEGEGGLLSIVFHPDYEKSGDLNQGVFFAFYNDLHIPNGDLVLEKYKVANFANNVATVLNSKVLLKIPHRQNSNHNGGEIHFGPDGLLYMSIGDGGGAGDLDNNAQRTAPRFLADSSHFLGKILRIDVNQTSTGRDYAIPAQNKFGNEIFDYGLRNPFRWSFDRQTGDMWIGDVGQENWEEIDFRAAGTASGINYGWNCFEGGATFSGAGPDCGTVTNYDPAYYYDGQSVIGGVVYRGSKYLDLIGYYVGTDHFSGNFHLIKRNDTNTAWVTTVQPPPTTGTPPAPVLGATDIGEGENGEIYLTSLTSNTVYHVEASGALPVKLVRFDGIKTVEGTRLFWITSSEENFREFEVGYSVNARQFLSVGTVFSANSVNGAEYQFTHSGDSNGDAYYRLKMTDSDGSFEYSKIIVVKSDDAFAGNFVRPSLINSQTMNVFIEGNYQSLELIGANGSVLLKQDISDKRGPLSIPVNNTASGIYIVRLTGNEKINSQKVMVLH